MIRVNFIGTNIHKNTRPWRAGCWNVENFLAGQLEAGVHALGGGQDVADRGDTRTRRDLLGELDDALGWNMVEQPLVFLKDRLKYPLSIFLSQIKNADLSRAFVCGILAMLPVLLLFLHFKDALMTGIENSALK